MIDAEQVKSIATVPAVLSRYGYGTDKRRIPCPLHGGRNPNFSFNDHAWHCFSCGRHGDAIQFAMDLFGLSFRDALAKLSADFGIAEAGPVTPMQREYEEAVIRFNKRLAREEKAEREERRREYLRLCKLHAVLYRQFVTGAYDDAFKVELAEYLDELEMKIDLLSAVICALYACMGNFIKK
jgi:DNA primase